MSFSYIKPDDLKQEYERSNHAMQGYFTDFPEYERIASAEPKNVREGNPDVTDATTASFIETRPKSIVQKNPSGHVVLDNGNTDLADKMSEMVDTVILPNATTGGSVKTKCLTVVRNMLIYGAQPALCFIRNDDNYFGADFMTVDIRDVFLEPGKTNASDCNYIFLDTWYTKADIDSIIYTEKELAKDKDYKSSWDLRKLAEMRNKTTAKTDDNIYSAANKSAEDAEFIKLVCAFQKGVGGTFYTFDPDTGEIIREWENLDPRGKIPIIYAYYDPDGKNPLGLSAIRLTRRLQDMLDTHFQNYQFQVGLKSAPPTKIRGNVNTESIVYEPYAVWDLGVDQNADASVVQTDNTLINTFPTTQGILKSNILNITNNGDTSVSAEVGNPGFSKTSAGVNAQQERIDIADNYLRGQFEEWFGEVLETMVNLHIAAHFQTEEDQVVPLSSRYIENKKDKDPAFDKTKETINYEEFKGVLAKFKVDASSSKLDNDREQLDTLNTLLETRIKAGDGMEQYLKLGPLVYQIVKRSGVPNADEIAPKDTLEQPENPEQEQMSQLIPQAQASPLNGTNTPSVEIPQNVQNEMLTQSMPAEEPTEAQYESDPITELIKQLVANGLDEKTARIVAEQIANGADPAEIENMLKGAK